MVMINAEEHRDKYPEETAATRRNLYVDDSLNTADTESEGTRLRSSEGSPWENG